MNDLTKNRSLGWREASVTWIKQAIREAFRDPNSELHDWLEEVEAWAHRSLGGYSRHLLRADQILLDASERKHRDDIVDFVRKKQSHGVISDDNARRLLSAGVLRETVEDSLSPARW